MKVCAFQMTPQRMLTPRSLHDVLRTREAGEESPSTSWIDVDRLDGNLQDDVFASLELHPLAIEACLDPVQVSGLVAYGKSLFIGLPIQPTWDAEERTFLRIVCLPNVIVTVHDQDVPTLRHVAERYCDGLRFHQETTSAILYQILDHVIDEDMAHTLRTRDAVDRLEELLDEDADDELMEQTLPLKRQLARLAATCEDQLYCVGLLQTIESEAFCIDGLRDYFRDAVSHLDHASRSVARQVAHLTTIQQEHQLMLQNQTNDRLRLLTVISTIFLPLMLIAGVYGMNFPNMPELTWRYSYAGVLLTMATIVVGMLWGFYRAGWFR